MAFPTTAVLDDFNRADTGPPPSASWTGGVLALGGNTLKVISNQCGENTGDGDAVWNPSTFGPDSEVFCTLGVTAATAYLLYLRAVNLGATPDGYMVYWEPNNSYFYRMDNGSLTQLGLEQSLTLAVNDKFGGEMIGSTLTIYAYTGGAWASVSSRTDGTYSAAGNIGMGTFSGATRFDDFGGGTIGGAVSTGLAWIRA